LRKNILFLHEKAFLINKLLAMRYFFSYYLPQIGGWIKTKFAKGVKQ
jgi:hypothetical protein